MIRNRIYYGAVGVFVGPSPASGYHFDSGNSGNSLVTQLERIQSFSDNWDYKRENVNQLGQTAAVDRIITTQPTVNLSLSADVADVANEQKMGLYVSGDVSCLKTILDNSNDEHNYFLAIAPEGQDIFGWTGENQVIQITNGRLSSYTAQGAVGRIPTVDFGVLGLNWATSTGSINTPVKAVNPLNGQLISGVNYTIPVGVSGLVGAVSAIRPGDIQVSITSATVGVNALNFPIQSYRLSFDLARDNLQQLGNRFAYAIVPKFPVTVSASIVGNLGDLTDDSISNLYCNDANYNIQITLYQPSCTGLGPVAVQYTLKGMKIDGEQGSINIGDPASQFTINYSTQIGSATQNNIGVFISGQH